MRLLYISPLKALNNDIQRNLRVPLAGIRRQADEMGLEFPPIRVAVRSGDTPQRERRAMLRQPPHILITTPESLYLLLTSPQGARDVSHRAHGDRGRDPHPGRQQARRAPLAQPGAVGGAGRRAGGGRPVQRLGLSATIQPLDEVARFLGGSEWQPGGHGRRGGSRPCSPAR